MSHPGVLTRRQHQGVILCFKSADMNRVTTAMSEVVGRRHGFNYVVDRGRAAFDAVGAIVARKKLV